MYVVRASPELVESWATGSVPVTGKGWQLEHRTELRRGLKGLLPQAGQVLHALYALEQDTGVDVENATFFNIGLGTFAHLVETGIRYERSFGAPPPAPDGAVYPHYLRYSYDSGLVGWREGALIAEVGPTTLTQFARPGTVYAAIRRQNPPPTEPPWEGRFILRAQLAAPAEMRGRLQNHVKAILDGVVCAHHQHDGSDLTGVASGLALMGGITTREARADLVDPRWASLGERRLLWQRQGAVQWDPADDRCVAGEITLAPEPVEGYSLTARLWRAESV